MQKTVRRFCAVRLPRGTCGHVAVREMVLGAAAVMSLLPLALVSRTPHTEAQLSRRSAISTVSALVAVTVASSASAVTEEVAGGQDTGSSFLDGYKNFIAGPGFKLERDGPYMKTNPVSGQEEFIYPIVNAEPLSSAPLLIFGAAATRLGGLLPDELPFNIFQKILRRVLPDGVIPDLADNDYRKRFQNTWYGTNKVIDLPWGLNGKPPAPEPKEGATETVGSDDGVEPS